MKIFLHIKQYFYNILEDEMGGKLTKSIERCYFKKKFKEIITSISEIF